MAAQAPSQFTASSANEYLMTARNLNTVEIERNAGTIGEAIAMQMRVTRSFYPALGQFLYFRGRPFHEGMARMMQPAFTMNLSPMSLWKCGRQVGKSLTMAAKSIILGAMIPYFSTLTVTPLFEMARRLSSNYVDPLISESPVRTCLTGFGYTNNVLQKTFKNMSMMHFSFAFLDCDRVRGLAVDRLHSDECVAKFSSIQTVDGYRLIGKTLSRNDKVLAFDENDRIVTDTVKEVVCKGVRPAWRLTLEDGRVLVCTANEKLRTDFGWTYLQEVLDYAYEQRTGDKVEPRNWVSQRSATWDDTRGRVNALGSKEKGAVLRWAGVHDARLLSGGVLPAQSGPIEGLRGHASEDREEQGLGKEKLRFLYGDLPGIRLLVSAPLQGGRAHRTPGEACDQGAGVADDTGELGVPVHGRRAPEHGPDGCCDLHPQLRQERCASADSPVVQPRDRVEDGPRSAHEENEDQGLVHRNERRSNQGVHCDDQAACAPVDGVQGRGQQPSGGTRGVPVLRPTGSSGEAPAGQHGRLPPSRVPGAAAQDTQRPVSGAAREAGGDQRQLQGALLQGSGAYQGIQQGTGSQAAGEPGDACQGQRVEAGTQGQEPGGESTCYRDGVVQLLRGPHPSREPEKRCTDDRLLEAWLQEGEAQAELNSQSNAVEGAQLTSVGIMSIEYAGEVEVWDVETENHHTLFVNGVAVHNCQDIDPDFIPIMAQTMGRSKYRIQDFSGTPKTFDNTMEILWRQSSRAEWIIPCSCGYHNDPNVEADAFRMIGKHTLVCAKCNKPLNANAGHWEHMNLERNRRVEFPGYHIPQFILPFHYEDRRNWATIRSAVDGDVATSTLYNEILAESFDSGTKLVTETDLKTACKIPVDMKDYAGARRRTRHYIFRVLGIDWGGRGATGVSMTKAAVMGMRPDGHMELIYGENMSTLIDEAAEVVRAVQLFNDFSCDMLAHDAGGSGGMRDVLLSNSRFPMKKVMPFVYVRAWANNPITFHPGTEIQPKAYYSLDKARSLALMANMIKSDWMWFPKWDSCHKLIEDFLALVEEKNETKKAGDLYLITRSENSSDDFAHAVNFACMCAFHTQEKWPDLLRRVEQARFDLTAKQVGDLAPNPTKADWMAKDGDVIF